MAFDAGDIEANLTLNRTTFDQELEQAKADVEEFEKEVAEAQLGLDTADLDEKLDDAQAKLDELDDEIVEPTVGLDDEDAQAKIDELQSQIDELSEAIADPTVDIDDEAAEAELDDLKAQLDELQAATAAPTVTVDDGDAQAKLADLQARLEELEDTIVDPSIGLDDDEAEAKLDEIQAQIDELSAQFADPTVTVDDDEASAKIVELSAELEALAAEPTVVSVEVDDDGAVVTLEDLRVQIGQLQTDVAVAKVDVTGSKTALAKIAAVQAALDAIDSETMVDELDPDRIEDLSDAVNDLDASIQNLGNDSDNTGAKLDNLKGKAKDAESDFGGLMGAAVALAPALGIIGVDGAAAFAAFGASAGTALVGLGAFALAADDDLTRVEGSAKAMLATFQQANSGNVMPALQGALADLPAALDMLTPLVGTTAHALEGLESVLGGSLGSPFWSEFSEVLAGQAGAALSTFGTFVLDAAKALAGLDEAFSPFIDHIETDIDSFSARMAAFGASALGDTGIAGFVSFLEREGPVVASTLEGIAHDVEVLAKDLEPLGAAELSSIDFLVHAFGDLATLSPGIIQAGAAVYTLYKASQLLGGVSGIGNIVKDLGNLGTITLGGTAVTGLGKLASTAGLVVAEMGTLGLTLGDIAGPAGIAAAALLDLTNVMSSGLDTQAKGASEWVKAFVAGLQGVSDPVAATRTEIGLLTEKFNDAFDAAQKYTSELEATGDGSDKLSDAETAAADAAEKYQDQIKGLNDVLPGMISAQQAFTDAQNDAVTALITGQSPAQVMAAMFGKITTAENDTSAGLTNLTALMNIFTGDAAAVASAEEEVVEAFSTLTSGIKTNGTAFEGNSDAAISNRNNLGQLATSIDTTVSAMAKQGDSISTINSYWDQNVSHMQSVLTQSGLTTGQIADLEQQFGLTTGALKSYDDEAATNVGKNASLAKSSLDVGSAMQQAEQKADTLKGAIHDLPATHTTTVLLAGGAQVISGAQGVEGALAAIPRLTVSTIDENVQVGVHPVLEHAAGTNFHPGGLAWVGEKGPELMNLPRGTQVMPSTQSMALAHAGAVSYPGYADGVGLASMPATVSAVDSGAAGLVLAETVVAGMASGLASGSGTVTTAVQHLVTEAVSEVTPAAIAALVSLATSMQTTAENYGLRVIEAFTSQMADGAKVPTATLEEIAGQLPDAIGAKLVAAGPETVDDLKDLFESLNDTLPASTIDAIAAKLPTAIGEELIKAQPATTSAMKELLTTLSTSLSTASEDITEGLAGATSKLGSYVAEAVAEINKSFSGTTLASTITDLGNAFTTLESKGVDSLSGINTKLAAAQAAVATLQQEVAADASSLEADFSVITTGLSTTTTDPTTGEETTVTAAVTSSEVIATLQASLAELEQYRALLTTLHGWGLDASLMAQLVSAGPVNGMGTAQALVAGGKDLVSQADLLESEINANSTAIGEVASTTSLAGKTVGLATAQGVVSSLEAEKQSIITELDKIAEAMKTEITDTMSNKSLGIDTIGADLMSGLAAGIASHTSVVTSELEALAESMKAAIKAALGISSPSTVFAEYGTNVVEGFAQGITGSAGLADSAINDLIDGAVSKAKDIDGSAFGGTSTSDVRTSPSMPSIQIIDRRQLIVQSDVAPSTVTKLQALMDAQTDELVRTLPNYTQL